MSYLAGRTVILGVGGGIAVYRACELARLLMKRGAAVHVAMTARAREFVAPLTFRALTGNNVLTDLFSIGQEAKFGHLALGHAAQLFVVAPATANLIARIRAGMADDAVTTSLLASQAPVLLAPAMNCAMWENPLTQENVTALVERGRFHMVGPGYGMLAEGIVGYGRMAEPEEIAERAEALLAPRDLLERRVLITAGPTREQLDPVRFISNPSTGRMGFALAREAALRGARVTLVAGPTELTPPASVELVRVGSAQEMQEQVMARLAQAELFIAAAAVSDQRPAERSDQKVKKREGEELLRMVRTPDILAGVSAKVRGEGMSTVLVGFAAETEQLIENAREKLQRKQLDLICANDLVAEGSGFATETNSLVLLDKEGGQVELPLSAKEDQARRVIDRVIELAPRLQTQ